MIFPTVWPLSVSESSQPFPTSKPWDNSPQHRCQTLVDLRDKSYAFAEAMRTAELQIEMLTKEEQRTTAKAILLQGEHDKLKEILRSKTAAFQQQREAMKKEYAVRVSKLLESRRHAVEKKSQLERQQAIADAERSVTRAAEFKKQQEANAQAFKESMEKWVAEDTIRRLSSQSCNGVTSTARSSCSLHCEQQRPTTTYHRPHRTTHDQEARTSSGV